MSASEKIFGSVKQRDELIQWLVKTNPELLAYINTAATTDGYSIALFPAAYDRWLVKNCPFEWLVDQILTQYGME